MIRHLAKKCAVDPERIPLTLEDYGNTGGPSDPLTITMGGLKRPDNRELTLLMLAYGIGLSWGSARAGLPPQAYLNHVLL